MPITIQELKEMNEEFCYLKRQDGTSMKIIQLLKETKMAYNASELTKELSNNLVYGERAIRSSKVAHILLQLSKTAKHSIHKKGSYYYYEEK